MPDRIRARGVPLARGSFWTFPAGQVSQARRPSPPDAGPAAYREDTMDDDGYDLLAVRIRRGTTINGAVVALCPDEHGVVTADVCIDGPPVP
jgi:hypothetical protein